MPNVFVLPPGWSWDIVVYFFVGGLTGGIYFVASVLRLVGTRADHPLSRIGWYLAFPLINICALLLIKDLGVPQRFWHMVFQSEDLPALMFKWWSPISFGTYVVLLSGVLPVISFLYALGEGGIWRVPGLYRFTALLHDEDGWPGKIFLVIAAGLGLLLAGYTGALLTITNVPTWSGEPMLPVMFMASGVATGAAAIFLVAHATRVGPLSGRHRVLRTAFYALVLEALALVVALIMGLTHRFPGVGFVSPFYLGGWAFFFWLVVLPIAFAIPLVLLFSAEFRGRHLVNNAAAVGAASLLIGGFLFRMLEVFGGQAYYVPY